MNPQNAGANQLITHQFQNHDIATLMVRGQQVVLARDVGVALDYNDQGRGLTDLIRNRWQDEFIEGLDYFSVDGDELKALKQQYGNSTTNSRRVKSQAPSLLLLTETGLHLVLVKTDKPLGKVMRRWVVDTLIPSWRAAHQKPEPKQLEMAPTPVTQITVQDYRRTVNLGRDVKRFSELSHAEGQYQNTVEIRARLMDTMMGAPISVLVAIDAMLHGRGTAERHEKTKSLVESIRQDISPALGVPMLEMISRLLGAQLGKSYFRL